MGLGTRDFWAVQQESLPARYEGTDQLLAKKLLIFCVLL